MNSDAGEDKPVKQKATDSPRTAESSPGQESTSSRPPKKNFVEVTELTDITYKPSQHSQWMDSLMEAAPDARPSDCLDEEEGEEESTSNKSDYTGHVLALNGHKKYFCIFRPVFTGEEAECSRWSDEDVTRKASRSRSSSRQKATTLEIHHKLDRLGQFYHGVKFEVSDTSTTRLLKIEVQSVKVDCKVTSRFAHTVMTTKALNKANVSQEVSFEVELPKTSFITNFSMEIDGKTYTGEVKEKEKAKEQYQKAVASGQTAGLVKASGRKMEKFSVSVNVAAKSTIVADIYEPQGIAFVDAYGTFMTNELLPLVEKTVTDKKAHVSFSPTLDQQRKCTECEGTLIDGDFFIKYDVNRPHDIGDIQIVNGYFVHFFAPANLPRVPKMVVFVIDNSLSMVGNKMAQTREALVTILGELPEEDYFAIIVFSSYFVVWRPHLSKATQENVKAAQEYVKTIEVFGSTELHNAVIHGVEMLYEERRNGTAPKNMVMMIILLTDGEPNKYPRSLPEIQESIRNANDGNITIFSLAFGNDANYGFLDTLSKQNNGLVRRIYEDSDAPLQLAVVKLDVHFRYPDNTVNSLTKSHFKQLYNGSEIMVAGRLNDLNDIDSFAFEVFAQGFDNNFEVKGQASTQKWETIFPDEEYIFGDFTERLWAYLTIQELLNKKDKGTPEEKGNATNEALSLSLKYNFVTPLTSMVVTKPKDETKSDTFIADKLTEEERGKPQRYGYAPIQASYPKTYASPTYYVDGDPHFVLELPDQNDALCFNIDDKPGTIFNLVRDPRTGIVVNGQTIGDKKVIPGNKINTYFGRFGIIHEKFGIRLMVSTKEISVSEKGKQAKLFWTDTATVKGPNMDLQVIKGRSLTVTLRNSVKFLIILHKVWQKHPYHQDYLGFYTLDSHLFSSNVHGLLGQFYHGLQFEVSEPFPGKDPNKPDALMFVKGKELVVTRGWQRDFRQDVKNGENVPCWFIHNNGTGLLDGVYKDYIVSGLFKTI
ncbi:inter-alpha-trypsin inhibitor heavy chain H3-like protein [Labeo rohita]|uniref:Inter-alpha-trypsin inhibitor heavy chain H3 n=1 Tax=Labeo rohita TaxID=84645 RepID=A0A498ND34_LABRO|nr:inter-alpha-trypsin inhibitor heavy chain H3-like protein [Labeo rohita]